MIVVVVVVVVVVVGTSNTNKGNKDVNNQVGCSHHPPHFHFFQKQTQCTKKAANLLPLLVPQNHRRVIR